MEAWQSSTEDQRVLHYIEHGSAHQQTFFAQASISCLGNRALAGQAAAAAPQTVHQALPRFPANGPAAAAAPAAGKKAGHHPLATAAQTARNTTAAAEFRAKHPLRPQPRPQSQTAAAAELRTVKQEQTPAAQAAAPAAQAAAPAAQATAPAPKAAPAAAHAGQKRSAPEQASLRQGPSEEARRLQQQLSHVHAQQARNAASEAARTAARAAEQTAHTKRNAQREAEYAAQCTELEKQAASEALVPQQAETLTEAPTRTQRLATARRFQHGESRDPSAASCRGRILSPQFEAQFLRRHAHLTAASTFGASHADWSPHSDDNPRLTGAQALALWQQDSGTALRVPALSAGQLQQAKAGGPPPLEKPTPHPKIPIPPHPPPHVAAATAAGTAGAAGGLAGEASEAPPGVAWRNCRWSVSAVHWIPYIQPAVF